MVRSSTQLLKPGLCDTSCSPDLQPNGVEYAANAASNTSLGAKFQTSHVLKQYELASTQLVEGIDLTLQSEYTSDDYTTQCGIYYVSIEAVAAGRQSAGFLALTGQTR